MAKEFVNHCSYQDIVLLVIGGDGSFNEVLNGIKLSNKPYFPFTYLPAESGNDFTRAANLETNPEKLIFRLLKSHHYETVDCALFKLANGSQHYLSNNFGIGFDAFVVHQSNHSLLKKKLNQLHCGNLVYRINIINGLRK